VSLRPLPDFDSPALARTWRKALAVMSDLHEINVPCAMPIGLRRMLFQIVTAMGAQSVLDIGTYCGTSALTFALAGARVTTVDIKNANSSDGYWVDTGRRQSPQSLMMKAGVADRVQFVAMDSVEYLQATGQYFDFVSIDGWHEWHQVYKEIPLSIDRLNPGGLIYLDDIHSPEYQPGAGLDFIPGPWIALQRHLLLGSQFKATYVTTTMDGEPVAGALLHS
jgi:predicted O-methyltransferase YrrM